VLNLREDRLVKIYFYDLAGHAVRQEELMSRSGALDYLWDGRDDEGKVVVPGIYVCQITVEADDEDVKVVRLVNVAY